MPNYKIQLRRDNDSTWATANPTLSIGEVAIVAKDNDNKYNAMKIGDGVLTYNQLPLLPFTSLTNMQKYFPVELYGDRVSRDSGIIKDLDRLTELYMNQLNLLPYTHFLWDGNAGYKVTDGKLVKAYDMSPNGNDGTTSSGTEPFAGGLIAPNESVFAKTLLADKKIAFTELARDNSHPWTASFSIKLNVKNANNCILSGYYNTLIVRDETIVFYVDGNEYAFNNAFTSSEYGKTLHFVIVANGNGNLSLYKNGKYLSSFSIITHVNFSFALASPFGHLSVSELYRLQLLKKAMSAHEIELQHELLRLQHPEIEGVNIGNQHWATSNYEGVVTGNGTVIPEVQDASAWAALTTPAWCYYNNDPALGAVYGKLYNWYAVNEIAKNPPKGWRVPSEADFIQLRQHLDPTYPSTNVAGKKIKAIYGGFNNANSTNESGFSAISGGQRDVNGGFILYSSHALFSIANSNIAYVFSGDTNFIVGANAYVKSGFSLRLLRNEPVGPDNLMVSTGRFNTNIDIAITAKVISIPFGYAVEKIVIDSSNNLTGIKAIAVDNTGYQSGDTYFQGESMYANTSKAFAINVNQTYFKQDAFVYVWATGNTGDGMIIDVVLSKISL